MPEWPNAAAQDNAGGLVIQQDGAAVVHPAVVLDFNGVGLAVTRDGQRAVVTPGVGGLRYSRTVLNRAAPGPVSGWGYRARVENVGGRGNQPIALMCWNDAQPMTGGADGQELRIDLWYTAVRANP